MTFLSPAPRTATSNRSVAIVTRAVVRPALVVHRVWFEFVSFDIIHKSKGRAENNSNVIRC